MDKENMMSVQFSRSVVSNMIYIHHKILLTRKNECNFANVIPWMDWESIMLSEISQIKKDKYCMITLLCGIKKKQSKQTNKTTYT